jgi:hypothetical protein
VRGVACLWGALGLAGLALPAVADPAAGVNALRAAAGLPALARAPRLEVAAARHAAYLDRHREPGTLRQASPAGDSAHRQQAGLDGFSGESPGDRALAAGYPHREVLENVSMGYPDLGAALDGLMSAIYHRLTFLDLRADAGTQRSRRDLYDATRHGAISRAAGL